MTAALKLENDFEIAAGDSGAGACARRDAFVRAHCAGTFFHLSGWAKAVHRAYGYEPIYLEAYARNDLVGVLTLSDIRAPLTGRALIGSAFSVGGGALATDAAIENALMNAAIAEGKSRNAAYIECRAANVPPGWTARTGLHAGFTLDLLKTDDAQLAAIPRKRRAELRKALSAADAGELSICFDGETETFYPLYANALHGLGTPVFPKRFLAALLSEFSTEHEIAVVASRGEPVAALVSFYFGDAVLPYYIGAAPSARALRAFDYVYWRVMRRAAERGCTRFDFGRSRVGAGSYRYKEHWGACASPMTYAVKPLVGGPAPNVSPSNPTFAMFARLWPHLPAPVASSLGPLLAPNFP